MEAGPYFVSTRVPPLGAGGDGCGAGEEGPEEAEREVGRRDGQRDEGERGRADARLGLVEDGVDPDGRELLVRQGEAEVERDVAADEADDVVAGRLARVAAARRREERERQREAVLQMVREWDPAPAAAAPLEVLGALRGDEVVEAVVPSPEFCLISTRDLEV